jgi:hypothetical protein
VVDVINGAMAPAGLCLFLPTMSRVEQLIQAATPIQA